MSSSSFTAVSVTIYPYSLSRTGLIILTSVTHVRPGIHRKRSNVDKEREASRERKETITGMAGDVQWLALPQASSPPSRTPPPGFQEVAGPRQGDPTSWTTVVTFTTCLCDEACFMWQRTKSSGIKALCGLTAGESNHSPPSSPLPRPAPHF